MAKEHHNPPDETLVDRAVDGDVAAFEVLISRYQQSVFNIAYYKSRNCFDAEDLSQEIFLAAFRALSTLKDRRSFSSWLFGIAYNRCHKWFHRERNKIVKIDELRRRMEVEQRVARKAAAHASDEPPIGEILARVPDDVREVLRMKYLDGLSYTEIEDRLDLKPHQIDYLIRKGKKSIRDAWKPDASEDGAGS
ncbi:MAG: RNA polymerase sigma factor [Planctomycetota bacterium]